MAAPAPPLPPVPLWSAQRYRLRQKVLSLGRKYYLEDDAGNLLGYCEAALFKLREELRVYADEAKNQELLVLKQAQLLDATGRFEVRDAPTGQLVGSLARKFWRSWVRDEWVLLDAQGAELARLKEESMVAAVLTRLPGVGLFVPKRMLLFLSDGAVAADFQRQLWSLGTWSLSLTDPTRIPDRRLLVAGLILMEAVEQQQE